MAMFMTPDWDQPLDVEAYLRGTPDDANIRGMYPAALVRQVEKKTGQRLGERRRYIDFKYYPMREHIQLLAEGAPLLYPQLSLRRAFRELARMTVPTLRSSMVGKVLHNLAGGTTAAMLAIVAKGYGVSRDRGTAKVVENTEGHVIVELRDIFEFPSSLHVGIFESGLLELGNEGRIDVREHDLFNVDLKLYIDRTD